MLTTAQRWGVEIEGFNINRHSLSNLVESITDDVCVHRDDNRTSPIINWAVVHDGSIREEGEFELRTPVMYGETEAFMKLRAVCQMLQESGAKVNDKCGLHVHQDVSFILKAMRRASIRQPETVLGATALSLYERMEPILDTVMPPSRRGNNNDYCVSVVKHPNVILKQSDFSMDEWDDWGFGHHHSKLAIDSIEKRGSIEYRQHSGTFNAAKITAWVKLTWLIQQKIANIVLGIEKQLPTTFSNLNDLMEYVEAPAKLRAYYVKRQDTLSKIGMPVKCDTYWSCFHPSCKSWITYINWLLKRMTTKLIVSSRSNKAREVVNKEEIYRALAGFELQNLVRTFDNFHLSLVKSKDVAVRITLLSEMFKHTVGVDLELSKGSFHCETTPPPPPKPIINVIEESVIKEFRGTDYSGGEQPTFLSLTKAQSVTGFSVIDDTAVWHYPPGRVRLQQLIGQDQEGNA